MDVVLCIFYPAAYKGLNSIWLLSLYWLLDKVYTKVKTFFVISPTFESIENQEPGFIIPKESNMKACWWSSDV